MKYRISAIVEPGKTEAVLAVLTRLGVPVSITLIEQRPDHATLLRDAQARQKGLNLDNSVRRETVVPEPYTNTRRAVEWRLPRGCALVQHSLRGRVILSVFKHVALARMPEFVEAIMKEGYAPSTASSVLNDLIEEGAIVRQKRGLYRLPLPSESVNGQSPLGLRAGSAIVASI